MIHLHLVDNLLEPGARRSLELPWRPGASFAELVPEPWRELPGLLVARHGQRVLDLAAPVRDRDHVIVGVVPGATSTVGLILLLVATTTLQMILAPKLPGVERGDERSPTYGFSGIQPTRAEGTPIPRVYGRIRAGGQVLSEFVESRGPLGSWYNALVSLGHGPIQSICGVTEDTHPDQPLRSDGPESLRVPSTLFINDTPATDYDGVELHVRLGTAEQAPIVGFNLDDQTTDVSAPLTGPPGTGSTYEYLLPFWPLSPGGTTGPELASEDATWALYGVAQSILDRDVDHFTVTVEFPSGLYSLSSTGAPYEYATSIAVRYVELDGGGAPITTGGPHADGYVRLRPTPLYRAEVQGAFTLDFRFPFYDPQTFALAVRSRVLSMAYSAGSSSTLRPWCDRASGLNFPPAWVAGSTMAAVSAEWWACLRPNGAQTGQTSGVDDTSLTVPAPLLDLLDTATSRGFRVVYRLQQFQVAAGQFRSRIVPVVQVGNGSTIKDYFDRNRDGQTGSSTASELGDARWRGVVHSAGDEPQTDWAHGAFTYQPEAVGALDRLRVYCDGELIVEVLATLDLTLPATATVFNLAARTGSNGTNLEYLHGHLDEVLLWSRELSSDEVRRSFNTGFGTYHAASAGLVAGYHFEEGVAGTGVFGAGATIVDFGPLGNDLTARLPTGGATQIRSGALYGILEIEPATNTVKRSRYRVEVMRALKDVTTTSRVDDARWALLHTHVDEQFSFPGQALMAVRVRAQDQLSGARPALTAVVEGALVPVWDGASVASPSFARLYSRNPAWVLADLHLDRRAGLGQFFEGRNLDVASFQELADYADELVYDLRGDLRALDETLGPVQNLRYDGTAYGGLGRIQVEFAPGVDPPVHLVAGTYVGFDGLNTPASNPGRVFQDCSLETVLGFFVVENLTSAENGGAGGLLRLQYQPDFSLPLADPPWGGAGDLTLALSGSSPDFGGTLQGREPRFCYDGVVDETRAASDVLQNVVTTCRTILVREGTRVRLRVLKPEAASDLVGQTQEIRDTFEISYASPVARSNAYDATILDADLLWDRSTVPLEDAGVADGTNLGAIRRGSISYEGITRRSQAFRMLQFLLNSNRLAIRSGKFTCSVDSLALEVGDVVQVAHDCVPRGTSGRVEASTSGSSLTLDRRLVLESGKTYDLSVRTLGGGYQTSTVTSAAGTYEAAVDALTVSPAFDVQPERGQAALLCEQGRELLVRITRISLTKDLQRELEWVEYVAAALDVDELGGAPDLPEALARSLGDLAGGAAAQPADVLDFEASERLLRAPGSAAAPHVALSWRHDPATEQLVARTDLYLAVEAGPWRLLGRAAGLEASALLRLPDAAPGTRLRFAAVPVSRAGAQRPISRAAVARLTTYARGTAPAAPLELTAAVSGTEAVYAVRPGDRRGGATHQVRAGGWLLGQPLLNLGTGQDTQGSAPWLRGARSEGAAAPPPLLARARAHDGAVSREARLVADLLPAGVGALDVDDDDDLTQQSWEDFGDGWRWTGSFLVPPPNGTLTGLQVNAANELEFEPDVLEGTYETADLTTADYLVPRRIFRQELVHLSAFAVAEQRHPLTFADARFTFGEASQLSFEGPASDLGDPEDRGQCRLWLTVRLLGLDGAWSEWQDFRPGPAACTAAQFRINLTRPDASFQVRVKRFSTLLASLPQHAVPNRRIDPASPVDGAIWLRTDL